MVALAVAALGRVVLHAPRVYPQHHLRGVQVRLHRPHQPLELFVCGDQLLRGAALNAVLIAERVARPGGGVEVA